MRWFTDFHTALTFLTCLGRARLASEQDLRRAMPMYPLVGALLGALFWLCAQAPLLPPVWAWVLCAVNVLLTRGLHWDGWADLWDGWGSGRSGEEFWAVVKDSRIGAFGVVGLVLGLGMQATLLECALRAHAGAALFMMPVFGRFCCLFLALWGQNVLRSGLGKTNARGIHFLTLVPGLIVLLCVFPALPVRHVMFSLVLAILALGLLVRLGRRQGGINGDFLGAAIIAGELCALIPLAFWG